VFLINTTRGALVDEAALLKALEAGQIAGAGLDVFAHESLAREGHPLGRLYAMENVILTPPPHLLHGRGHAPPGGGDAGALLRDPGGPGGAGEVGGSEVGIETVLLPTNRVASI
jgi:hypothetical protein